MSLNPFESGHVVFTGNCPCGGFLCFCLNPFESGHVVFTQS